VTRAGKYLLAAGALILLVAVAWWWLTYGDVVEYTYLNVPEAVACLVGRSGVCDLARSLCRGSHPAAIVAYWWGTFWIGVGFASVGLTLTGAKRVTRSCE
jgi:FtsH-binding integral membrane protein